MKKLFSKALSLVLTLALLATVFCCLGVTTSAVVTIPEEKLAGHEEPVYRFNYANAELYKGKVLFYIPNNAMGKEITISFDYWITDASRNDGLAIVENASGKTLNNDAADSLVFINAGYGRYSNTTVSTKDAYQPKLQASQSYDPYNGTIYIYNFNVTVDGEDKTATYNPTTFDSTDANVTFETITWNDYYAIQPAVKFSVANTVNQWSGFYLTKDIYIGKVKELSFSFDYYVDNETANMNVIFRNNVADANGSVLMNDEATQSNSLRPGYHRYSYSNTANTFETLRLKFEINTAKLGFDLYVWNFECYADGKRIEAFGPNSTNASVTMTKTTQGELDYLKDITRIEYSNVAAWKGVCLGYKYVYPNNRSFEISFKYKYTGPVNGVYVVGKFDTEPWESSVSVKDETTGSNYLIPGEHTFSFKIDNVETATNTWPTLETSKAFESGEIYIWDLVIGNYATTGNQGILRNGRYESASKVNANGEYTGYSVTVGHNYSEIVANNEVKLFDFDGTDEAYLKDGDLKGPWYQFAKEGDTTIADVVIYFDYYLASEDGTSLMVYSRGGGAYKDTLTGSYKLRPGRHTFCYVGEHSSNVAAAFKASEVGACNAKLYVWNLMVTRNGQDIIQYKAYSGSDFVNTPTMEDITYSDIDCFGDANNDGKLNVMDLIRVKKALLYNAKVSDFTDVNLDSKVDAEDLVRIKLAVASK